MAIAGTAAMLGSRSSTSAEVQGAPLAASAAVAREAISASAPDAPPVAPTNAPSVAPSVTSGPGTVAKRTAASVSELLDLSQLTLAGDHYEAVLKDGRHAVLTLDPALQTYAEKLLAEARAPRGAIVAMAPDGRILALAGRRAEPGTDADGKRKKSTDAKDGTSDWRLATDVWAPAASVFKLVTASALVAAGVMPDDKVCFHGGLRSVLESNLHDDKHDSRCESLLYGVAHSNNAILGKLAFQKLEPPALVKFATDLGIAHGELGDLQGSAGAIEIPPARDLSFAQTAAGFAGSQLSAVGGALLAATFADDGEQPVPRVIASIDGAAVAAPARRRAVPAIVAKAVSKMMLATCEMGSAAKSFGRHQAIHVAGKTGTLTRTEPFYMEHSWFVGYAPAEKPEIVVSVVLGNPENWHLRGHEAARRLIDRAIGHDKDRTAKITSTRHVGW
ncbi:MAG TPA: penicillin-binding transpeptidase domain-containing protein [Kofleriaceae bacterium]|nr:penicillin-binding transpeptidase domain-containing protein [Kofleriaceae bacterium]